MRRLDVVWMVIAPWRSHAFRLDVIRDHIMAIDKRLMADSADSFLFGDLPGEEFSEFCWGTKLPVSSRMIWVVDALDAPCLFSCSNPSLAPATDAGVVDGADLVSMKFH